MTTNKTIRTRLRVPRYFNYDYFNERDLFFFCATRCSRRSVEFNTLFTSNTTHPSDVNIMFSLLFIIFQLTFNFG